MCCRNAHTIGGEWSAAVTYDASTTNQIQSQVRGRISFPPATTMLYCLLKERQISDIEPALSNGQVSAVLENSFLSFQRACIGTCLVFLFSLSFAYSDFIFKIHVCISNWERSSFKIFFHPWNWKYHRKSQKMYLYM